MEPHGETARLGLKSIHRALISVSDKTNIVMIARALASLGVHIISTGGTAKALAGVGIDVTEISDFTGFPEMMDGRVKTLHPKVHGGLLAKRDHEKHQASMLEHAIQGIDLLVVNLYPFEDTVAKGAGFDDCIENIDIGGPAMIRSAAKNHKDVAVVIEPADYMILLGQLREHGGSTTFAFRKKMAAQAYAKTAAYDTAIANWFTSTI